MRNLTILVVVLFISCSKKQDSNDALLDFIMEKQNGKYIEFPELYNQLANKIPDDKNEKLILVEKLKNKGFEVKSYGRGNYPPLGPRIISVKLKSKNCECEVDKISNK